MKKFTILLLNRGYDGMSAKDYWLVRIQAPDRIAALERARAHVISSYTNPAEAPLAWHIFVEMLLEGEINELTVDE